LKAARQAVEADAKQSRKGRRKTRIAWLLRFSIGTKPTRRFAKLLSCNIDHTRAVVFVLAIEQRRATVPAQPCRHRRRLAERAILAIARQIDDVAGRRYVFFNHGCPRGYSPLIADKFRPNVQPNGQILAEELRQELRQEWRQKLQQGA
jgi:hypothetical protein